MNDLEKESLKTHVINMKKSLEDLAKIRSEVEEMVDAVLQAGFVFGESPNGKKALFCKYCNIDNGFHLRRCPKVRR
jgi:hypothetical protein